MDNIRTILIRLNDIAEYDGETISDDWIKERLDLLWNYYRSVSRHNYSDIAEYIVRQNQQPRALETIQGLCDNIKTVIVYIEKILQSNCEHQRIYECYLDNHENKCGGDRLIEGERYTCRQFTWLYRKLIKLEDHILLEQIRLIETTSLRVEQNNSVKKQMEIKDGQNKLVRANRNLEKQARNMHMQFVSILGIFAAIIIGVFGGMNVISSITNAFVEGDITPYKTLITVSLTTLFVGGIIFLLLSVIVSMQLDRSMPKEAKIAAIILTLICIAGIILGLTLINDAEGKQEIANKFLNEYVF